MRLNASIKIAMLTIVVILFLTQTFYSQSRPRLVLEQADHPESTQSVETISRETNLAHALPTVQTDQLYKLLAEYRPTCPTNDNPCNLRKVQIRAAALHLINLVAEDRAATIPSRREFQAKKFATYHHPNFGNPARRAPIRRKGRTQH